MIYGEPTVITDIRREISYTIMLVAEGDSVSYSWQSDTDPIESGSGTLFENYETVGGEDGDYTLKDLGSSLKLDLPELEIEWSTGGEQEGWLYLNPSKASKSGNSED